MGSLPSVIPEGSVFLLCGFMQHLKESVVSSSRQAHLKAAEGLAKALLAITNLCLLYTNAEITEDVMLLKANIYAFFFVSACVDLTVYVKLVPL